MKAAILSQQLKGDHAPGDSDVKRLLDAQRERGQKIFDLWSNRGKVAGVDVKAGLN